jgi:hypothetical protein
MDTVYSLEELAGKPQEKSSAKPKGDSKPVAKPKDRVIPLSALDQSSEGPPKPDEPGFVSETTQAIKGALKAAATDPSGAIEGMASSVFKGGVSLINTAMSGVGALAKSMVQPIKVDPKQTPQQQAASNLDQSVAQFTANKDRIDKALKGVNDAEPTGTEAAMNNLLMVIPNGSKAVGDTIYEKTGSALAATGGLALATLVSLSPEVAGKVMSKAGDFVKGKPASTTAAAFDELAAGHPEEATQVANHINLVDPETAKALHKRIQKYIDASEKDLNLIGRNAADAAIKELEGNYDEAVKGGTVKPPEPPPVNFKGDVKKTAAATEKFTSTARDEAIAKQRMMLSITPERASSTIRETVRQAQEAISEPVLNLPEEGRLDMTKSKEERALERERVAAKRARDEGQEPEFTPEPVPRRAAEHEGEVARRRARDQAGDQHPDYETVQKLAREAADKSGKVVSTQTPGNDIVYFNSGIPISREMIIDTFNFADKLASKIPGVEIAKGKMGKLYDKYIETFNPEAVGPQARTVGSAIAQNFFEQAHREHLVWENGKKRRTYWNKMGEKVQMAFLDASERGKSLADPLQEKARLGYKAWAADIFKQDMKTGFTYDPIDHYMPHMFKDAEGIQRWMTKKYGNKWADPRFIKERGFDFYKEAVEAGFTPKFTNPEEIMQARQMASDIAALRVDLLADLERKGMAVKAAKGSERPPEGFSTNSRRAPTGQRYWVREEADPLMHNAFDSKSLWSDRGFKGDAFRGYMELKNKVVPIKLMGSLFHPMHVLHIDAAAELTRGTTNLLAGTGNPLTRAKDFMLNVATSVPFTPGSVYKSLWDNPRTGYPILRVFQGKRDFATLSDADKAAYHDLAEGGLVPTRPREEMSSSMQKFQDAWGKRSASAAFHLPFAAIASLGHPIYGVWIPTLKIASFLKDAKNWRSMNPDATPQMRQEAFRNLARKVESRYGEMNYNSMFMDKVVKDIGVATNLSLGWNIGLIDQYAGGAIDLGRAALERGSLREKVAKGQLDRPIFAAYYVSSALMVGGLMHYYFTHKPPATLVDYTHPQSGEVDKFGQPVRLNTMFYTREFEGLYKHMQIQGAVPGILDFVANKGSGMMEMMSTALKGVDSLGQEVRDPDGPAYKQIEQTLLYELADVEPISLEAINKSRGNTGKNAALAITGFTPAGKYISQSVTEGKIENDYNKFVRPREKPYEAVERSKDYSRLAKLFDAGGPAYDQAMDKAIETYQLTGKDVTKLEKSFGKEDQYDPSLSMFVKLPWERQRALLDKMTPVEREKFLPKSNKAHLRNHYEAPE